VDDAARAYDLISGTRKEPYLGILLEYSRAEAEIPRRIQLQPTKLNGGRIKVGVIGAGNYATNYLLPHLRQNERVSLNLVCTSSGATAAHIARKFGFAAASDKSDGVIEESDAVVVATRHNMHAEYALGAIRKGKAVFVEKPLAITEAQLTEVAAVAQAAGRASVMVGFNRRFAPATLLAAEFMAAAKTPKQVMIRVNAGAIPRDHWVHNLQVGGGRLIGEGCHFVDLGVCLTGSQVKRVTAVAIPRNGMDSSLWDDFSLVMEMEDHSIVTVVYTCIGDPGMPKEHIEISAGSSAIFRPSSYGTRESAGGRPGLIRTKDRRRRSPGGSLHSATGRRL
jgi:polar amino acid transport system substrate-binding protein